PRTSACSASGLAIPSCSIGWPASSWHPHRNEPEALAKHIHRLIMTSAAYRQGSQRRPELEKIDPDNRLLGRMSIRRLEAEALRDALLAVSGKLNTKPFGPPVPVTHDEVGQVVVGNDIRNTDGAPK